MLLVSSTLSEQASVAGKHQQLLYIRVSLSHLNLHPTGKGHIIMDAQLPFHILG